MRIASLSDRIVRSAYPVAEVVRGLEEQAVPGIDLAEDEDGVKS